MGAFLSLLSSLFHTPQPITFWTPKTPAYIDYQDHPYGRFGPKFAEKGTSAHINAPPEEIERLSIPAFVERAVPSLHKPFKPTWYLPNGHLQTIYCILGDFTKVNLVHYYRKILHFPDGGSIALDLAGAPSLPPTAPILVVCHGLAGGSYESYVRDVLAEVVGSKQQGGWGWRGAVCNFRGCGGTKLTSPQLYSAGNTNDLRAALLYLSIRFPGAPMVGIGFSLGAGVLTRYLGEEGERSRLRAGMALGCPWDLHKNGERLEENWFVRNTYSKAMGTNLRLFIKSHLPEILAHPRGQNVKHHIDDLFRFHSPSIRTVDSHVTKHLGGHTPPFPFATVDAYYRWASCHTWLPSIRVPFLAVNADDDPIVNRRMLPLQEIQGSDWCVLGVTRGGGHLGWFTGNQHPPTRWIHTPILQFAHAAIRDYVPPAGRSTPGWERKDGWVYQVDEAGGRGEVEIGYKEEDGEEELVSIEDKMATRLLFGR
ncbi:AB-hydrolase YheT [Dacryopinax primogenitus]|uniref:AB-hydrolase YheT n=1 Tax=Dacryopinax primogenitus (strain DJM 731) TaxID=1858805 RepID=M5FTT9_DACPD|nr:AB-hydrolase YheT [Dacryopinax primogenitus]EJT96636.1 AB-hydrolase YheT [Dacryopinax primogenitus]